MKLLVIGDYISDVYTFGTATRLCPEAPVPVIVPGGEDRTSNGGAGLVWEQLLALGLCDVRYWYGSFSEKKRVFAGNHLVCRVDRDSLAWVKTDCPLDADAFVIADYGKGAMTPQLAHQIVETGKPCFVDAKHHWHWYRGQNVTIFPNEHECLDETFMLDQVVKKLGKDGCEHRDLHLAATVSEVVDTTGAGDIFMAGFVYAWTLRLLPEDCLQFANALAGESCRHIGTHVVGREFAQSVLDRLRASKESQQPVPESSPGSTQVEHVHSLRHGHAPVCSLADSECGNPLVNSGLGAAAQGVAPCIPQNVQTPPESPSGPTLQSDTRIRGNRVPFVRNAKPWHLQSLDLSPSDSERPREHTPGPDQAPHPGKLPHII